MGRDIRVRMVALCALAVVPGAVAGCGSSGPPSPSGSAPASSAFSPTPSASTSTPTPSVAVGCDVAPWHPAPVTVTHHVAVPPVPVITAVRVAQHPECGYDRVVLDVHGRNPSYSVRYVDHVIADASGKTITMPGSSFLLIVIHPAQAHTAAGPPTVTSGVREPGYPALESWALAGDFEGYVRIAFGVSGHVSIRTAELAGRIYIDLKE
jgi:hypothetical protein